MINTVEGRISAETIGVTMCHEHLAMDLSPVRKDRDSVFDDLELIEEEVKLMKALGVQSVIEVSCNDMGRMRDPDHHVDRVLSGSIPSGECPPGNGGGDLRYLLSRYT